MPTQQDTHPLVFIRSDITAHFTGALITNAMESETIAFPQTIAGTNEVIIEGIILQSIQNLDWDVFMWTSIEYDNTSLNVDSFLDYITLPSSMGKSIGGAGQYYYSATGLQTRYKDLDGTKKLHISIVNRSATSKIAGANGAVSLTAVVSPILFV
jgi:hypothetical protein